MIERISATSQTLPAAGAAPLLQTPSAPAAELFQTLAADLSSAGSQRNAGPGPRVSSAGTGQTSTPARALDAVDGIVVRNLLDSLSPSSRIAGSFYLADTEETTGTSLFAAYYEEA
jgi:hypothetical protein